MNKIKMHPTNYTLDNLVAKDISKFTQHSLKSILQDYDQHSHWLSNCILNSIFTSPIPDKDKPGFFSIVRKGEHTISEYEISLSYLEMFLKEGRKISDYFRALSHLEVCLSAAYQVFEYIKKLNGKLFFQSGDGSLGERLNRIYNISKHLQKSTFIPQQLHLFWFTNTGFASSELELKYEEIEEIMRDICTISERTSKLRYENEIENR